MIFWVQIGLQKCTCVYFSHMQFRTGCLDCCFRYVSTTTTSI